MTALWQHLDATQHAAITCALTLLVGLFLGAASVSWSMRRVRQHREFDAIDWSNEVWAELDREAS